MCRKEPFKFIISHYAGNIGCFPCQRITSDTMMQRSKFRIIGKPGVIIHKCVELLRFLRAGYQMFFTKLPINHFCGFFFTLTYCRKVDISRGIRYQKIVNDTYIKPQHCYGVLPANIQFFQRIPAYGSIRTGTKGSKKRQEQHNINTQRLKDLTEETRQIRILSYTGALLFFAKRRNR